MWQAGRLQILHLTSRTWIGAARHLAYSSAWARRRTRTARPTCSTWWLAAAASIGTHHDRTTRSSSTRAPCPWAPPIEVKRRSSQRDWSSAAWAVDGVRGRLQPRVPEARAPRWMTSCSLTASWWACDDERAIAVDACAVSAPVHAQPRPPDQSWTCAAPSSPSTPPTPSWPRSISFINEIAQLC